MRWTTACGLGAGLFASCVQAQGQDGPLKAGASAVQPIPSLHGNIPAAARRLDSRADPTAPPTLSDSDLGANRAGQATVTATQTLNAVTSSNTINGDLIAGSITLSGNALSKFNGVGNFAINTGSQVSIQSGMNLTINIKN